MYFAFLCAEKDEQEQILPLSFEEVDVILICFSIDRCVKVDVILRELPCAPGYSLVCVCLVPTVSQTSRTGGHNKSEKSVHT